MSDISRAAARLFSDAADAVESGKVVNHTQIAVTGLGGEFGEEVVAGACQIAVSKGYGIHYLGSMTVPGAENIKCTDKAQCSEQMANLLASGVCGAAVTMNHAFPIGTATVGRIAAPSRGKEMFIATTTGTPSPDRVESLVLGALYGIIAAKSCGFDSPAVGILNIDGAHRAESCLRKLRDGGFPIEFADSARADGGVVMRGNDALLGTADVLVCDPLTGNVLMKMMSAFNSGGDRECFGYGYGPGIGKDARSPVMIVSRASDTPVILNAIVYASDVSAGNICSITKSVLSLADKCGLHDIMNTSRGADTEKNTGIEIPEREPVTESITGIEIMDIEEATRILWKNGIYAQSGMGCTGPVVIVSTVNLTRSMELLRNAQYI